MLAILGLRTGQRLGNGQVLQVLVTLVKG